MGRAEPRNRRMRISRIVEFLTEKFPAPYPVRVVLRGLPQPKKAYDDGFTKKVGARFFIYVHAKLSLHAQIDTLLHEWAHAVTWRHARVEARRLSDHDDEWALAYGRIYRAYHEDSSLRP